MSKTVSKTASKRRGRKRPRGRIDDLQFVKMVVFDGVPASDAIVKAGSRATTPQSRKQMGHQYRQRNLALIHLAEKIRKSFDRRAKAEFAKYLRSRG